MAVWREMLEQAGKRSESAANSGGSRFVDLAHDSRLSDDGAMVNLPQVLIREIVRATSEYGHIIVTNNTRDFEKDELLLIGSVTLKFPGSPFENSQLRSKPSILIRGGSQPPCD
jgi:hypothetical protein